MPFSTMLSYASRMQIVPYQWHGDAMATGSATGSAEAPGTMEEARMAHAAVKAAVA